MCAVIIVGLYISPKATLCLKLLIELKLFVRGNINNLTVSNYIVVLTFIRVSYIHSPSGEFGQCIPGNKGWVGLSSESDTVVDGREGITGTESESLTAFQLHGPG